MVEHHLHICPGMVQLGPEVDIFPIFRETIKLISNVVVQICTATSNCVLLATLFHQHELSICFLTLAILRAERSYPKKPIGLILGSQLSPPPPCPPTVIQECGGNIHKFSFSVIHNKVLFNFVQSAFAWVPTPCI